MAGVAKAVKTTYSPMIRVGIPPWPTLWTPILFIFILLPKLFNTLPHLNNSSVISKE
jgi:hypothetical protein